KKTLAQLCSIEPTDYAYGKQTGSIGIDFVLSEPWMFGLLFGAPTYSAAPTPNTFTYDISSGETAVRSAMIEVGFEGETGSVTRRMEGSILNSLNISANVDDLVNCSCDFQYGKEALLTTDTVTQGSTHTDNYAKASNLTATTNFPYTFAHAELKYNGGTVAQVQSADITFTQGANLLYGLDDAQAVSSYRQLFEITGRFQASMVDHTYLDDLLAQIGKDTATTVDREQASIEMVFTNGLTSTNERTITITLSDIGIESHNVSGIEPVEPVFEEITWQAKSCVIVAENEDTAEKAGS
ncbi:MAG: hypothetical protein HOK72_07785, partial [Flavobacteriales bacterium]|nr:hypothetical protein [Flavobacteriales bacterium]